MDDPILGKTISKKYDVLSLLGRGGMGAVYKVKHTDLNTVRALKILPLHLMESKELIERFYREARIMAQLEHPNIVRVHDIQQDEERKFYYFVMDYIHGRTVKEYLRENWPLPLSEVVKIVHQVASALNCAHIHNPPIVHRDVKPANIMIENQSGRVVLMDFGIAKETEGSERTQVGSLLGTVKYCSPEQLRHEPLDGSADIYSLGMVMYEVYTGRQFFAGLDEYAVMGKVLHEAQENTPRFDQPTSTALVGLMTKAIAKSRENRYHTVTEFLKDLETYQSQIADSEAETIILSTPDTGNAANRKRRFAEVGEKKDRNVEDEYEKIRQELLQAKQQSLIAKKAAEEGEAARYAAASFTDGGTTLEKADQSWEQRKFREAALIYRDAQDLYEKSAEEARRERSQSVLSARQRAEEERVVAERANAEKHLPELFAQAKRLVEEGQAHKERGDFTGALMSYEAAERHFKDIRQEAEILTTQERETHLQQQALEASQQAEQSQAAAERAWAHHYAQELYQKAIELKRRGDQNQEAKKWEQAAAEFAEATGLFSQAVQISGEIEESYWKGEQYYDGSDVEKDYAEAAKWYGKAAEQGHTEAQTSLGFLYEKGLGVPQDYAEAVKWYQKAAEQGEPFAQVNLGVMYENGKGAPRDYAEAVKWYREAAEQGHARAQYSIGIAYEYGRGVSQDHPEAMKWYGRAAEQGDADAQRKMRERDRSS